MKRFIGVYGSRRRVLCPKCDSVVGSSGGNYDFYGRVFRCERCDVDIYDGHHLEKVMLEENKG